MASVIYNTRIYHRGVDSIWLFIAAPLFGLAIGFLMTLEVQMIILGAASMLAAIMLVMYSRPTLKLLALASIFFAPFLTVLSLDVGVQLYISSALILIALPFLLIRKGAWRRDTTAGTLQWALGSFVLIAVLSSIFGYADLGSWHSLADIEDKWSVQSQLGTPFFNVLRENFKLILLYGAFLVIVVALRTEKEVSLAVKVYVLSAALQSLYSLYTVTAVLLDFDYLVIPGTYARGRGAGTFGEPVFYGSFMSIAIFLNLYLVRLRIGRVWKYLVVLNMVGLLLSFSAAAYYAVCVGLITLALRKGYRRVTAFAGIIIGVTIYIVASSLPSKYLESAIYKPFFSNPSRLERLSTAKVGLKAWEARPILGVGHGLFPYIRGDLAPIDEIFGTRPNNVYLDILAETGTVGIFVFIWTFWLLLAGIRKCRYAVSQATRSFVLIGPPLLFSLAVSFLGLQSIKYFFLWALLGILGAAMNVGQLERKNIIS